MEWAVVLASAGIRHERHRDLHGGPCPYVPNAHFAVRLSVDLET
jgi:hypothetical protein